MYVVDQANNHIVVLGPDYQVLRTIPTGPTPRQAALGPDGDLYYTDDPYQTPSGYLSRLVRVDLGQDDAQTVVMQGLPFMSSITFGRDGSFYLGTGNGKVLSWYSADGQLLASVSHGGLTVDAVAYYPPPSCGGLDPGPGLAAVRAAFAAVPAGAPGISATGQAGTPGSPTDEPGQRPGPDPAGLPGWENGGGSDRRPGSSGAGKRAAGFGTGAAGGWLVGIGAGAWLAGDADPA
jgi:hypothetical protein